MTWFYYSNRVISTVIRCPWNGMAIIKVSCSLRDFQGCDWKVNYVGQRFPNLTDASSMSHFRHLVSRIDKNLVGWSLAMAKTRMSLYFRRPVTEKGETMNQPGSGFLSWGWVFVRFRGNEVWGPSLYWWTKVGVASLVANCDSRVFGDWQ